MKEYTTKILKVLAFISVAVVIGVITKPELLDYIQARPDMVTYIPLINLVLVALKQPLQELYIKLKKEIFG